MAKGGRETAKEGKGIERKEEKEGGGEGFEELERSEIWFDFLLGARTFSAMLSFSFINSKASVAIAQSFRLAA